MRDESSVYMSEPRRGRTLKRKVLRVVIVLVRYVRDLIWNDVEQVARNLRLFLGAALVVVGVLSFTSDRYCDGNASSYAACTRPSTYYYYPWWAITLVVVGTFLVVLWALRRRAL